MSDTEVNETPNSTILTVPVVKGKTAIPVDYERVAPEVYLAALNAGFKDLVNAGMTKVTKEAYPEPEKLCAKAIEIAKERVEQMYAGTLKLGRKTKAASDEVPSEVMTEARRIARQAVKDLLRDKGHKVSHFSASQITGWANEMIAADPGLVQMARANIESRKKVDLKISLDNVKEDPKLVAKAEKAAAEKKATKVLSAKQAGKPVARASHAAH